MQKLSVQDIELEGERVFIRADLNVPLNPDGTIRDDTRIRAALPTIEYVIQQGGKAIIASHLGRPKGRDSKLSLNVVAKHIAHLTKKPVAFAPDCIGAEVKSMVNRMENGSLLLLENLRFHRGETHPEEDPSFALKLSELADVYVDDAFGSAHRAHSSIVQITHALKQRSCAGFLLEREVTFLSTIVSYAKHPFFAICGGAKVSTKLGVLSALIDRVDALFIGGGMAFTFLKAQGIDVGDSIVDNELIGEAKDLIHKCKAKEVALYLPEDIVVTPSIEAPHLAKVISLKKEKIAAGEKGVDIGPQTIANWSELFKKGSTLFWNGPMGIFETPQFAKGTFAIAEALSHLSSLTIVGGGDSVAAVNQAGSAPKFSHISTGGGASLEYIENGHLPGIDALSER